MPKPNPALLPRPALFDVTIADSPIDRRIDRISLKEIELAANARRDISQEGIERLAAMLCRTGQLIPCIGHRPSTDGPVLIYDGQRRYLAANASHELAGSKGYEGLQPIRSLIVLLLDHEPSADEIRRIQAQANQREQLSLVDQQEQFRDCWAARAGLREEDRIAAVCADLGISAKRAHNLRRQLTLPDEIRARVAERPAGEELSVTMANRLADMHEIAPQLTEAVAKRITTDDLHDKALKDMGAFVHRTVVEDEHTYAVRIDDGALLDAAEQIEHARAHLTADGQRQIAAILGCELERLDARARHARRSRQDAGRSSSASPAMCATARATAGTRSCTSAAATSPPAIWVVDPAFMLDLVHEKLREVETAHGARGGVLRRRPHRRRRATRRGGRGRTAPGAGSCPARRGDPQQSGARARHPRRADRPHRAPSSARSRQIVCRLLVRHYRELIAYGAGWTDPERQQPVGDTGRHEPRQLDAIVDAELERALADPDPLRGIAQLTARWAAAFVLDPAGVTRTKALGSESMARKLRDALPGGEGALRAAVWEFMRPMLSPALVGAEP